MIKECLGDSSMRLGVPFIAPRQLGAVGNKSGRPSLPSVSWRTGQSGAHRTVRCTSDSVRCSISFLNRRSRPLPTVADLAHQTVRCPHVTVGSTTCHARIARPTVGSADRWLTGQSGAPPDSPVIYSRTPPTKPESSQFARASLAHRTLSGAPPDSPVHPDCAESWLLSQVFSELVFSCF